MGRFHCVFDGCAEVWYREFLPERLSYQYSGEEIQIIEGKNLTYTVEQEPPPFTGGQLNVNYRVQINANYYSVFDPNEIINRTQILWSSLNGAIISLEPLYIVAGDKVHVEAVFDDGDQTTSTNSRTVSSSFRIIFDSISFIVTRIDGQPDTGGNVPTDCIFQVFSNGNLIFTRTESSCPTVNYFPAQPSDEWKTIKIAKEPTWEKIQVVDNNSWHQLVSELKEFINGDIPDECIEIWKTPVLDLDILPGNTRAEKYQFIGQYCSPTGCLPPEYQVICRDSCEAEKCPPGTCEVECADHLCCYDSEGIAILTIDK